jgi:hypothetical protein
MENGASREKANSDQVLYKLFSIYARETFQKLDALRFHILESTLTKDPPVLALLMAQATESQREKEKRRSPLKAVGLLPEDSCLQSSALLACCLNWTKERSVLVHHTLGTLKS